MITNKIDEYSDAFIDSIPDVVAVLDNNYGVIRYNAAGCRLFNLSQDQVVGKKCYELLNRTSPCKLCALTQCYQTQNVSQVEKYCEDHDIWFEETAYPVFDDAGKLVQVFQHYRDISAIKKIKLRLLMLERALNQSIDGIAVADMNNINQFVNPAWASAHGYSVEEMLGENLYKFHPEEQVREHVRPFFEKVRENGSHRGESEHTKKDGTFFATYMMASMIKNGQGQDVGFVGTVRDITELKVAQKELEEYRDQLEKLVAERTRELTAANQELNQALIKVSELSNQLEADNINLREEIKLEHNYEEIIGQSDALKYVLYRIEEVAPTDATVMILGPTGTGKELFARAIHNHSKRKNRPLVKVDCSALPSNLIESELFGHERGAFSGAVKQRKGRFEVANGSTIFLDEIGELPLELQAKLLRVLEDGEFERLGSSTTIRTNVRVIAATNRNLQEEVEKGRFRQDLWYRLNVFSIKTPALKDRVEDIPYLVKWFVDKFSRRHGKSVLKVSQKTMTALRGYDWPGNIRELSNMIESAIITSHNGTLTIPDLPKSGARQTAKAFTTMATMEKDYIIKALEQCQWRIEGTNGAAKVLDMNPGTLRGRMRKHGIQRP